MQLRPQSKKHTYRKGYLKFIRYYSIKQEKLYTGSLHNAIFSTEEEVLLSKFGCVMCQIM